MPIIVSAAKGKDIGTVADDGPKGRKGDRLPAAGPQRQRRTSSEDARPDGRAQSKYEKGQTSPVGSPALSWSAAVSAAHEALFGVEVTEYASRGNLPTSLLNHETSDHLLSRY
jgi:hypothetical protein